MTITNFAAGELSQNLKGRVDISQYYAGCQKLKNFEIIPTGGIYRRSGLQRIGKLHGRCRHHGADHQQLHRLGQA